MQSLLDILFNLKTNNNYNHKFKINDNIDFCVIRDEAIRINDKIRIINYLSKITDKDYLTSKIEELLGEALFRNKKEVLNLLIKFASIHSIALSDDSIIRQLYYAEIRNARENSYMAFEEINQDEFMLNNQIVLKEIGIIINPNIQKKFTDINE